MQCNNLYYRNRNLVRVVGFQDQSDGSYPTDASLTVTVYEGEEVISGPHALTYVAPDEGQDESEGQYLGYIPADAPLVPDGRTYEIVVEEEAYGYYCSKLMLATKRICEGGSCSGC